jgi:hypothetical protein
MKDVTLRPTVNISEGWQLATGRGAVEKWK